MLIFVCMDDFRIGVITYFKQYKMVLRLSICHLVVMERRVLFDMFLNKIDMICVGMRTMQ